MGKSRRFKHVDRNAHRFDSRRGFDPSPRTIGAVPADVIAVPIDPQAASRSRYPAKKSKRERRAERHRLIAPAVLVQAPTAAAAAPLLLTYQPRVMTPLLEIWGDVFMPEPANNNDATWCALYLERNDPDRQVSPITTPIDVPVAALAPIPLPRSAAITPWRRRNPLDIVTLWLRAGWRVMRPQRPRPA